MPFGFSVYSGMLQVVLGTTLNPLGEGSHTDLLRLERSVVKGLETLAISLPDHWRRCVASRRWIVVASTRIEGAKLSDVQVDLILSNLDLGSFRPRDEQEVAGYAEATKMVFDSWTDIPLTENHIKQLHGVLLKFSQRDEHHRGEYKKHPNNVEAFDEHGRSVGVIFESDLFDTAKLMQARRMDTA
jgi:hypothetical protein